MAFCCCDETFWHACMKSEHSFFLGWDQTKDFNWKAEHCCALFGAGLVCDGEQPPNSYCDHFGFYNYTLTTRYAFSAKDWKEDGIFYDAYKNGIITPEEVYTRYYDTLKYAPFGSGGGFGQKQSDDPDKCLETIYAWYKTVWIEPNHAYRCGKLCTSGGNDPYICNCFVGCTANGNGTINEQGATAAWCPNAICREVVCSSEMTQYGQGEGLSYCCKPGNKWDAKCIEAAKGNTFCEQKLKHKDIVLGLTYCKNQFENPSVYYKGELEDGKRINCWSSSGSAFPPFPPDSKFEKRVIDIPTIHKTCEDVCEKCPIPFDCKDWTYIATPTKLIIFQYNDCVLQTGIEIRDIGDAEWKVEGYIAPFGLTGECVDLTDGGFGPGKFSGSQGGNECLRYEQQGLSAEFINCTTCKTSTIPDGYLYGRCPNGPCISSRWESHPAVYHCIPPGWTLGCSPPYKECECQEEDNCCPTSPCDGPAPQGSQQFFEKVNEINSNTIVIENRYNNYITLANSVSSFLKSQAINGIPVALTGSLGMKIHTQNIRNSYDLLELFKGLKDIDVVVKHNDITDLINSMSSDWYYQEDMMKDAVKTLKFDRNFQVSHPMRAVNKNTGIIMDIFLIPELDNYQEIDIENYHFLTMSQKYIAKARLHAIDHYETRKFDFKYHADTIDFIKLSLLNNKFNLDDISEDLNKIKNNIFNISINTSLFEMQSRLKNTIQENTPISLPIYPINLNQII